MAIIVLIILIGLSVCLFLYPFVIGFDEPFVPPKKMPDPGITKPELPVGTYRIKPGFRPNTWVVEQYSRSYNDQCIYKWCHVKDFSTEVNAEIYIREQIEIKRKVKEDKERWERVKQENPPRTVPPYRFFED